MTLRDPHETDRRDIVQETRWIPRGPELVKSAWRKFQSAMSFLGRYGILILDPKALATLKKLYLQEKEVDILAKTANVVETLSRAKANYETEMLKREFIKAQIEQLRGNRFKDAGDEAILKEYEKQLQIPSPEDAMKNLEDKINRLIGQGGQIKIYFEPDKKIERKE